MFAIETVAVLGTGEDATALAVASALAGCAVRLHGQGSGALDGAFEAVRRTVDLGCAHAALTPADRQRALDGILITGDVEEAVTGADLVVASDPAEPVELGVQLAGVAELVRATAALAATSPGALGLVAAALAQPGRVVALRLTDTGGPLRRVEAFAGPTTSAHVARRAAEFASRVNRAARGGP